MEPMDPPCPLKAGTSKRNIVPLRKVSKDAVSKSPEKVEIVIAVNAMGNVPIRIFLTSFLYLDRMKRPVTPIIIRMERENISTINKEMFKETQAEKKSIGMVNISPEDAIIGAETLSGSQPFLKDRNVIPSDMTNIRIPDRNPAVREMNRRIDKGAISIWKSRETSPPTRGINDESTMICRPVEIT